MRRVVLIISITLVLLLYCSMPIVIVLVGGVVQAVGGLTMIACLALFQIPILFFLKRLMPSTVEPSDGERK